MKKIFCFVLFLCVIVTFHGCSPKVFFAIDSDSMIEYDRRDGVLRITWQMTAIKDAVKRDSSTIQNRADTEVTDSIFR